MSHMQRARSAAVVVAIATSVALGLPAVASATADAPDMTPAHAVLPLSEWAPHTHGVFPCLWHIGPFAIAPC